MATTRFKGNDVHTSGSLPSVGQKAPDFKVVGSDLSELTLASFAGKTLILNIFPSIDTAVCATSVRKFNESASSVPNATVLCVSMDLPFAHNRFCGAEGLKNVKTASDFRYQDFGKAYGVRLIDGPLAGLLARSVVVVGPDGTVKHSELVPDIGQEPNYEAALAAAR
jgi:thiol peroxidase